MADEPSSSSLLQLQTAPREVIPSMQRLLGCTLRCTLDDGRTATGKFICLDRLKNMILTNVVEIRTVPASVFREGHSKKNGDVVTLERHLGQAMIPGKHLVAVHVEKRAYNEEKILLAAS